MSRQFKRAALLTLAKPAVTVRGGPFGAFFEQQPNGVQIGGVDASDGLRFSFKIEKSLEKQPNKAEIIIYNLAETSRAEFQRKPLHVRLDVGYDGEAERLFVGDLRWAENRRTPTGWETHLQCGDGERAFRHARVSRSFRAGTTRRAGIAEAVAAFGLGTPSALDTMPGMLDQFAGGLAMNGPAHVELTRLLEPIGAEWSIQDGRLQILRPVDIRADQALVVSQATGMLGSPEYGPPKEVGKPAVMTVVMRMRPGLTPGGLIQLDSRSLKGLFKVARLVHDGDVAGAWTTTVEATAR